MPHPLPEPDPGTATAVVVGGSLAGLTTALALARADIPVTLLERAPTARPSGAALSADESQLIRVLGRQRTRQALAPARASGAGGPVPTLWRDLHDGFRDTAAADPLIDLRHDTRVVSVGQDNDRARVVTQAGETITASVVIGADGHRSVVRRDTFPEQPDAVFAGYTLWLGVGRVRLPAGSGTDGLAIMSERGHHLLGYPLGPDATDTTRGIRRLGWAWYDASRNDVLHDTGSVRGHVAHHSLAPDSVPETVYADLATEARSVWPGPWATAIEDSIDRREVTCTPIAEYVPDRLVRGRVALVGDAAHVPTPMTGSGFPTSVDDAGALATALTGVPHRAVAAALLGYEDRRLATARQLVLRGQQFSRSFTAGT